MSADDSAFESAAIVLRTSHTFEVPRGQVWAALDSDHAWSWLPFGCGVRYDEPCRRVGMEREMGTVSAPWRFLWIQRERFWRYEAPHRLTYSAVAGTWPLLQLWAEDYVLTSTPGGCTVDWTVAITGCPCAGSNPFCGWSSRGVSVRVCGRSSRSWKARTYPGMRCKA
ncbi:Polyketide cyclase / dehydrase and lipid transport [Mycobacteroides abscessus subsp. abscessus]|nr:Polyketide cyclase / dehydrase and lipid transport [Mycobacteroides abscessus subsp. abscessus]